MLPAWATVVIALGASAITGIATLVASFRTVTLRARYERDERWRDRLIDAADDFSTNVEAALFALGDDIEYLELGWQRAQGGPVESITAPVRDTIERVARIKLLFGSDSSVGVTAVSLVTQLNDALGFLDPKQPAIQPVDEAAAAKCVQEAARLHGAFSQSVLAAIRGERDSSA